MYIHCATVRLRMTFHTKRLNTSKLYLNKFSNFMYIHCATVRLRINIYTKCLNTSKLYLNRF